MNTTDIAFDMSPIQSRMDEPQYYSQSMTGILMKEHVSMHNIESSINNCMLCPLNEYVKPLEFSKSSNEMINLMIIGDDPTDVLPQFSNGAMVHEMIGRHGLNHDYVHFTSLVKCVGSTNYMDCHHHLVSEVISIEPKVIIAFGYNAAFPFMGHIAQSSNQQLVPGVGYTLENGTDMIVVNHPKDIAVDPQSMQMLHSHLEMAVNHLKNKLKGSY